MKCRYCFESGHWKRECPLLTARNKNCPVSTKPVGCAAPAKIDAPQTEHESESVWPILEIKGKDVATTIEPIDYSPFITEGFVSIVGDARKVRLRILRDIGACVSLDWVRGASLATSRIIMDGVEKEYTRKKSPFHGFLHFPQHLLMQSLDRLHN